MDAKKRTFTIIFLVLVSISLSAQTNDSVRFKISIVQDGHKYRVDNNVIRLKKQPFSFDIVMNRLVELSVQASFDSSIYVLAKKGVASRNLKGFRGSDAMAILVNNEGNSIGITNEAHNRWIYESDSVHTFTKLKRSADTIEGKIQIDTLDIVSYPKHYPEIAKVEQLLFEKVKRDLFLVFVDRICGRHPNKDHYCDTTHLVDLYKITCRIVWE